MVAYLDKWGLARAQDFICPWCLLPLPHDLRNTDVDHIIPRCLGGPNVGWNRQVLHRTCNGSGQKGATFTVAARELAARHGLQGVSGGYVANSRRGPVGANGLCLLALKELGGMAATPDIHEWATGQRQDLSLTQVRASLHSLAYRNDPLIEVAQRGLPGSGTPNLWSLTEQGHAIFAASDVA